MPGVFISYRRDDTSGYAGRLYDELSARFGKDLVFIDIDSIHAGENFVDVIERRIASCSVVIVLMGKAWLSIVDERGQRRLDNPHDFVRLEVASAFRRNIPVIPVLVGGAKMPGTEQLPAALVPLAHLNAIEIFDQLFRESVSRLAESLRPFVRPKPFFPLWKRLIPNPLGRRIVTVGLLASVGFAVMVVSSRRSPDRKENLEPPPITTEALSLGDSASDPAPVKIKTPAEVTELPPIVEAARNVMLPGSSPLVRGPAKPRVLWRAHVTVGDAWNVIGVAADGTVFLFDREHNVLDAIRDGKEQWAYTTPSPLGFTADGRLWLDNLCFNSRGEGGRVTRKDLLPDPNSLRLGGEPRRSVYDCRDGKVYAMDSRGKQSWSVDLDGNCSSNPVSIAPATGNVYSSSDARTLYAMDRNGQLLWTLKDACKKDSVPVNPLLNDDLLVACRDQPLYALRKGKPLWTATIGTSGRSSWSDSIFDGAGNIYLGAEGSSPLTELTALDRTGKQIWTLATGTVEMPEPAGFDAQGRLYVSVSQQVVTLSQ